MTKILHFVPLGLCYDYGKFQISTFFTFVRKKPKTSVTCITAENWQKWGLPTLSPKLCDLACTIFMKLSGCHKETSKFIIQQFFCVCYKRAIPVQRGQKWQNFKLIFSQNWMLDIKLWSLSFKMTYYTWWYLYLF